jgi:hypothetical protein
MLKLTINNQICDLGEDGLNARLNRSFLDLQQIDKRTGDFSYTIRLPKTKTNNVIFQHANLINTIDKFVRDEEYTAKLETDGMSSLDGLFKLSNITEDGYEGVLISANVSWARLIQGKNLNELTNRDGTPWSVPYIGASGLTDQYSLAWHIANDNYSNSDVSWPLIPRSYFYHYTGTSIDLFYEDSLTISDIPPAPYELKVVKKIFEGIGWGCDGDIFAKDEHKKVILPFVSGEYFNFNNGLLAAASSSGNTAERLKAQAPSFPIGAATPYDRFYYNFGLTSEGALLKYLGLNTIISNANSRLQQYAFQTPPYVNSFPPLILTPGYTTAATSYHTSTNVNLNITVDLTFTSGVNKTYYNLDNSFVNASASRIRGGYFLYFHIDEYSDRGVYDDLIDYFFNPSPTASLSNPLIIYYFDCFQAACNNSTVGFAPYDANMNVFTTSTLGGTTTPGGHFNAQITGGSIHTEITNLFFGPNEEIRIGWFQGVPNVSGQLNDVYLSMDLASWSFAGGTSGDTSINLNITENLPDVSQLDFIKDFISRYNLYLSYDENNRLIRFDTFDAFFLPNNFAYDLTNKVDINYGEPRIKPMDLPRNIYFNYANDNGDLLINQDISYGNLQVTSDNIYTQGDQTVNSLFSATRLRTFTYAPSGVSMDLPFILTEADSQDLDTTLISWKFATAPRILKEDDLARDQNGNIIYVTVDGYDTPIRLSRFEDDRDETKLSLRFDLDNGLYANYYSRYLGEIADSHIIELDTRINSNDYINMLPNRPIKLQNQHYFLGSIDAFSPANQTNTKISLIKKFTN